MKRRDAGFTLMEIMIAVTILALMMVAAYGTVRETVQAKRHFEGVQERYREVRIAMSRIVTDLESAYISQNEDRNLLEPRTVFIGESFGDIDKVRFSTLTHTPLYADANESDQTQVEYYGERDPENSRQMNLMRRELRRPGHERFDQLPAEVNVVFRDIESFKVEYWDFKQREWKESWDTQKTDGGTPRVPDRVKVTIGFKDERGKEVAITTQARIYLQEALQSFAN